MTIQFPSNPDLNVTYTIGGKTWRWNGVAWQVYSPVVQSPNAITRIDSGSADPSTGFITMDPVLSKVDLTDATGDGSIVLSKNPTLTGFVETVFTVRGATPALSPKNGTIQLWSLIANSTPTEGDWDNGAGMTLMLDDGAGFTVTWSNLTFGTGGISWIAGGPPVLSTSGYTTIILWKVNNQVYGSKVS